MTAPAHDSGRHRAERPLTHDPNDATERVGAFEIRMAVAPMTAESSELWAHRAEVLTAWLAMQWCHRRAKAEE